MKKATFDNHPFDEKLCDNWHLYCVEMCLNARKMGSKVIVVPMQMHHFSKGTVTWEYMKCLKLLSQKYNVDFKYLWTTVYKVPANMIYINVLLCLWFLKHKMFG